jgi:hypothetical protein
MIPPRRDGTFSSRLDGKLAYSVYMDKIHYRDEAIELLDVIFLLQ